jgi:sugar phosphate permease
VDSDLLDDGQEVFGHGDGFRRRGTVGRGRDREHPRGLLSDRLLGKRRKPGMLISAATTAVMMYALISSPADPVLYGILLFTTGMMLSIGYSAYMVYPMQFVTKEKFPVANAVVNMGGQLGGAATPFITGLLLDNYGWDPVFGFMAGISCLTFIIVLTISEPLKVAAVKLSSPAIRGQVAANR